MSGGKQGGWTNYGGSSRKWHYTADATGDGRALCGRWARNPFAGNAPLNIETGNDDSSENCAECKRKKAKLGEGDG